MRRVPDEQFFDLRDWASEKAEDYGDKPSMVVHSMVLDKREKVGAITGAIHDGDRKSTRLNSSHVLISYAVFCLKKK